MMWGKRKAIAEDDTRSRCEAEVRRAGKKEHCGRLAKRYDIRVNGKTLGQVDYCSQHVQSVIGKLHVTAQRVDGRKKVEAVQL